MTHGHELRGREYAGGREGAEQRVIKGRTIWNTYNSIINKIYYKKGNV